MRAYMTSDGRVLFVASGLTGKYYCTFSRRPSGGLKRFKSTYLPLRASQDSAQTDLDIIAQQRGWLPVTLEG